MMSPRRKRKQRLPGAGESPSTDSDVPRRTAWEHGRLFQKEHGVTDVNGESGGGKVQETWVCS